MTNPEINIAIAEACGCSRQEQDSVWFDSPNEGQIYIEDLPDYCNDLNAMHEAEKTLGDRLFVYRNILALVVIDDPMNRYNEPAFATARQRAEAFLRALGKWEEARNNNQ